MIDYIFKYTDYIRYNKDSFFKKFLNTLLFVIAIIVSLSMILFMMLLCLLLFLLRYLMSFFEFCGTCISIIGFILFVACVIVTVSSESSLLNRLDAIGSTLLIIFVPLYIEIIVELIEYMMKKIIELSDERYILLDKVLKI